MEEAPLVEEPLVEETPPPEEAPLVAEPFVEETPPSEEAPPVEEQPLAGRNKTNNNTGQKQNKNRTKRNKKAKQTNTTKHNQNKIKKTKQDQTRKIYMFFAVKNMERTPGLLAIRSGSKNCASGCTCRPSPSPRSAFFSCWALFCFRLCDCHLFSGGRTRNQTLFEWKKSEVSTERQRGGVTTSNKGENQGVDLERHA